MWVLMFYLAMWNVNSGGPALTAIEFTTKERCEHAGQQFASRVASIKNSGVAFICVEK